MTAQKSTQRPARELVIDLTATNEKAACLTFYKITRLAMDQVGDICIDWGDGVLEYIDCTLSEVELQRMARDASFTPLLRVSHHPLTDAVTRIRIRTSSGFLPLRSLPEQTHAILSPLPTLTVGQTNEGGNLLAAKRLLPLIDVGAQKKNALSIVSPDLFAANPDLTVLDRVFYFSRIRTVDSQLFSPIQNPESLREIFAGSDLEEIPEGLLSCVHPDTVCTRAFADCKALKRVADPFGNSPVPFVVDRFLEGAPHTFFSWADESRRAQMGWVRPKASPEDSAFRIVWQADATEQAVFAFYKTDLELTGDLCVDWGDGTTQSVDFDTESPVTHCWEKKGLYTIQLHWTAPYPIRPLRFFGSLTQILDPLPPMHLRQIQDRGDYCGWAAGFFHLTSLPHGLFGNNPDITNLEQCFAGCVNLTSVPDDIVSGLPKLSCADSMFAFCYKLKALPRSYAALSRHTELDCFSQESPEVPE